MKICYTRLQTCYSIRQKSIGQEHLADPCLPVVNEIPMMHFILRSLRIMSRKGICFQCRPNKRMLPSSEIYSLGPSRGHNHFSATEISSFMNWQRRSRILSCQNSSSNGYVTRSHIWSNAITFRIWKAGDLWRKIIAVSLMGRSPPTTFETQEMGHAIQVYIIHKFQWGMWTLYM